MDLPDNESTNERANERRNEGTNEKAISLMFLCEKKQRNMWKSPKKICRNGDFRYISGIFSHILDIAITRLCAKNQAKQMMNSRENAKKYNVQLEKFKKYRFSGENRLFRRF